MSIKKDAHALVDQLADDAQWDDLVKTLYKNKKITLGMSNAERVKPELSDSDINAILGRLASASSQPSDMRDTRNYQPGNAATLGMVAGVIAVLFAFVFPPISWVAGPVAFVAGIVGLKNKEEKAWVPILLALVSIVPMLVMLMNSSAT